MSATPEAPSGTLTLACPACGHLVMFYLRRVSISAESYGLGADIEAQADHVCAWSSR